MHLIELLLLVFLILLSGMVAYLQLLTVAALFAPQQTVLRPGSTGNRFLILIPAHNEEKLLPETLRHLARVDYPADLFEIHVVADNCTDSTAPLGRAGGAIVHERFDNERRSKGYALQWLLGRLWDSHLPHDAILIIDADTIVSPNILRVMDRRLAAGERVIQAYYDVKDPARSWSSSLRYAALAVLHFLRPLGRSVFGFSAGLKGNGMVFAADVIRGRAWTAALTEDIEFHMELLLDGERVHFAPDAVVSAEMPTNLGDANTQNERWERGRLEMARRYVPRLLGTAFKPGAVSAARRLLLLDAVMEHVIPPFSILMAWTMAGLLGALSFFFFGEGVLAWIHLVLALFALLGQLIYLLVGLWLVKAPAGVYKALIFAPGFMAWKIWLYLRLLLQRSDETWIRTARNSD